MVEGEGVDLKPDRVDVPDDLLLQRRRELRERHHARVGLTNRESVEKVPAVIHGRGQGEGRQRVRGARSRPWKQQ